MASHRSTDRFERLGAGPVMPRTTAGLVAPEVRRETPVPARVARTAPPRDPAVPICKDGLGDTEDIYESWDGDGDGVGHGDGVGVGHGDGDGDGHGGGDGVGHGDGDGVGHGGGDGDGDGDGHGDGDGDGVGDGVGHGDGAGHGGGPRG